MSATGAIAEALFLKNIMESLTQAQVSLTARLDSSSARSLLTKAGVSRVRHLDTRLLWTQSLARTGSLKIAAIPTRENTADLGTKPLSSERV